VKRLLLPLMGSILCAATPQSAAADPAVPFQTKPGEEVHAALTDMPVIIDMSHADPKTWRALPSVAQVYGHPPTDLAFEEFGIPDAIRQSILALRVHFPF
jgi:hypothetical protein